MLFGQARYERHVCQLQEQLAAASGAAEEELQRRSAGQRERERVLQEEIQALQEQLRLQVGGLIPTLAAAS